MDKVLAEYPFSPLAPLPTGVEAGGRLDPPLKCLLCDIYGTLFISASGDIGTSRKPAEPYHALEALLDQHRIGLFAADLPAKLHEAIESCHAAARKKGIDVPEIKIDEIWARILQLDSASEARPFAMAYELTVNPVWPMPGLKKLIAACRQQGILMGIISNAQFYTLPLFRRFLEVDALTLGFHPDLTLLSYRHGCAKPSARLFNLAAATVNRLGMKPDEVAFIGNDMRNDILPSRQAGFQTILFAGDARSLRTRSQDPCCAGVRPDLVVTHLDQVAAVLPGGWLPTPSRHRMPDP